MILHNLIGKKNIRQHHIIICLLLVAFSTYALHGTEESLSTTSFLEVDGHGLEMGGSQKKNPADNILPNVSYGALNAFLADPKYAGITGKNRDNLKQEFKNINEFFLSLFAFLDLGSKLNELTHQQADKSRKI